MVIDVVTAALFCMGIKVDVAFDNVKLRSTLLEIFNVATAQLFAMPCKLPLPSVLLLRILLLVISNVPPESVVVFMPTKNEEPVPKAEQF